ncbi:MAG: DMT family transporter [Polyangiales bacterium]
MFGVDEAWALVGSGLVGLTLADTLYFQTLKRLGARRTLLLLSLQAPLAAVLAACTLHESITWAMLGGIALTTAGVAWVVSERVRGGTQAPATFAGVALGVLAALGNASANVLTKFGSAEHSALSVGAVRLAIGTVGLGVHLLLAGEGPALVAVVRDRRLAVRLTGAMFLGTYLGIWLVSAAIRYAPASVATTLSSTSPLFVLPLAVVFLRERVSVRAVLGTVLAIAGIALLFARSP